MKHAASADEEVDVVALTEWALEERLRLGLKSYEEQADERSVKESG
ncbi:MAG TPA: hypothetical protein VGK73_34920 [Polyangiaceae bacterium]